MGTAVCCNKDNDANKDIISIKEEEFRVEKVKAHFISRHEDTPGNDKVIISLQRAVRVFLSCKRFHDLISKDKNKIMEYLDANELFLKMEDFEILMHPIVKENYFYFKNKSGVFNYLQKINVEFDFMSLDFNTILYEENQKRDNCENRLLSTSQLYNPIWLNKEKKVAYMGFWNLSLKPNGYGILIKSDGSRYEGYFTNGQLNGRGRYFTAKGEFFEGNFKSGTASGLGIFIHPDGNVYRGDWHNDKTDGEGEEVFADNSTFQGSFKKGKKNGKGSYQWIDGSTYIGNFKDDLINGQGSYKWADHSSYEGEWRNNLMNGTGKFIFPDGTFYEGDFDNNKRSGQGKYNWSDEKYHIGTWKDGKQHGPGKYYKNNSLIDGVWHEGKLQSFTKEAPVNEA